MDASDFNSQLGEVGPRQATTISLKAGISSAVNRHPALDLSEQPKKPPRMNEGPTDKE